MPVDNTTSKFAKHRRIVFLFFIIIIALGSFLFSYQTTMHPPSEIPQSQDASQKTAVVSFIESDAPSVNVLIANTPTTRSQGLAVLKLLQENQGMLFIFDEPGVYPFWMKNMHFSIDILWLNEQKEIVYIHESAQPEDYPTSYNPQTDALYVLEVVDGFVQKHGIEIGDRIQW